MHQPIGIDPASGKETCIWINNTYEFLKAQSVRGKLERLTQNSNINYVIAWDAPVTFGEDSYSDRVIDKITRKWVKQQIELGVFDKRAINALPFSGLSHWVITCKALGSPFGEPLPNCDIAPDKAYNDTNNNQIIEVHPAVTMGLLWTDKQLEQPFPVYKKSKAARELIVEKLDFPDVCAESDDILDAYVAHLTAEMYINKNAEHLCSPKDGSYALPLGDAFNQLLTMHAQYNG